MSATLEASYQPLQPYGMELGEPDETPQDSGLIIHVVPENSRARWNHIEDLDSFFTRMYHYHQKHGFTCMMLQETLELLQFIFVVVFSTFLFHCVDYSVLFRDNVNNSTAHQKISLSDAVLPTNECIANLGALTWVCILMAVIFWILRAVKVMYHLFQFWDIKQFFNAALKSDLDNLTWHEIQHKVCEVQLEQQMCIHKRDLTELDIYHRILRFKNYMVAMVNKSLLPVRLHLPFLGEVVFLTRGLKYNIELLLFWGPWAPFENNWHLKEDYKKVGRRKDLAQLLSKHILWVGIANFVMCPLILLWQILYAFFSYAEAIKREPGSLGSRCWSLYGRLYLRHFNELDHELNARLNRAYRPASKYMNIFTSPLMIIVAQNVAFVAGACLAVLLILSVYDEDVITVEHVLTAITVLGTVVAGSRVFIPDENLVLCPEKLLTAVLAHAHYLPDSWRGQAHTNRVREEFSQLFYYKAVYLLQEMLSPVVTPFILCFHLRSKSLDIVDFYRNFTVEVIGVGDVCSFAQMDVHCHGNPAWQNSVTSPMKTQAHGPGGPVQPGMHTVANQYMQAEDGKTELSLVHFTLTNPEWQPPVDAEHFVTALRTQTRRDVSQLFGSANVSTANPLYSSLHSLSSLGFSSLVESILQGHSATVVAGGLDSSLRMMPLFSAGAIQNNMASVERLGGLGDSVVAHPAICGGLSHAEGPVHSSDRGLLFSLQQGFTTNSLGASVFGQRSSMAPEMDPLECTAADMSLSTLYLHELHRRQVCCRGYQESGLNRSVWQRPHQHMPGIRELGNKSGDMTRHAERAPLLDAATKPPRTS